MNRSLLLGTTLCLLPLIRPTFADLPTTATTAPAVTTSPTLAAPAPSPALPPVGPHRHLRVAIYTGPGAATGKSDALDALERDASLTVTRVTPDDIRAGKLADFDVLVQPGGSGSGQAKALGVDGRERIRSFVKGGGGFVGICGGSYLASDDYPWSLNIINTKVLDKAHWARGHGPVDVMPTTDGKKLLGADADHLTIIYWQGPIMAPANDPKLPAYTELARFNGEVHRTGVPGGVMPGQTAVAAAPYGKGRVVCFSPHPEKTPGMEPLLYRVLLWETEDRTGQAETSPVAAPK